MMFDGNQSEEATAPALLPEEDMEKVAGGQEILTFMIVCKDCSWARYWFANDPASFEGVTPNGIIDYTNSFLTGETKCPDCGGKRFRIDYTL